MTPSSPSNLTPPAIDPTPIFEHFRGCYATELLTAAVCHFNLFGRLAAQPRTRQELADDLALADRPLVVLTTALRAMGLLSVNRHEQFILTEMALEHIVGSFDIGSYIALAAQNSGVLAMVESLKSNRPAQAPSGTIYTYREGVKSAMDEAQSALFFTLALAGRARTVAPKLANAVDLSSARTVLDVAGGSGIYSIALLKRFPNLRTIVFDRGEVLKVATMFAGAHQVQDRLTCVAGDMFRDPFPDADVTLYSNVLHDWDVAECQTLISKTTSPRILIHDVFLNDALDGPLPHALYSAALFTLTEGRLYSAAEVGDWLRAAGFTPQPLVPTLVHCSVLAADR